MVHSNDGINQSQNNITNNIKKMAQMMMMWEDSNSNSNGDPDETESLQNI